MRVLHVSTNDITGGAARAAYRLHTGLQTIGIESSILVYDKKSDDPFVNQYKSPRLNLIKRIARRRRKIKIENSFNSYKKNRPGGLELFSDSRTPFDVSVLNTINNVDIINLHWVAGFIDYQKYFRQIRSKIPVVWTLHDMNTFTGGCHFSGGCNKFEMQCGACPQLGSQKEIDLSRFIWNDKQLALSVIDPLYLHVVSPSNCLSGQADKSSLLRRFSRTTIPNGLDTCVFKPRDSSGLRETLGIPPDAFIIGFVAESTAKDRKGFIYLKNAIELMSSDKLFLISIGENTPKLPVNINHLHLGSIQLDNLLSLAYSLFDLFVCPSVEDNLPNTVMESLACGTPVVGFNIGGMPDMVVPQTTGFLVPDISVESLKCCLESIIENKSALGVMSEHCREKAIRDYSLQMQSERYAKLYSTLLNRIS